MNPDRRSGGPDGRRLRTMPWRVALAAGLGTTLAVGVLEGVGRWRDQPFALIPFVTSIALVLGLPSAEPSRPRALVGGHILSTLVGYATLAVCGSSIIAAAVATGVAVAVMLLTRTMHPPAGIDPFLVVNEGLGASFLLETVLPGALLLAAFASLWRRLGLAWTRASGRPDPG